MNKKFVFARQPPNSARSIFLSGEEWVIKNLERLIDEGVEGGRGDGLSVLRFKTQTEASSSSGCDDSELPNIHSCKNKRKRINGKVPALIRPLVVNWFNTDQWLQSRSILEWHRFDYISPPPSFLPPPPTNPGGEEDGREAMFIRGEVWRGRRVKISTGIDTGFSFALYGKHNSQRERVSECLRAET